MAYESEFVTTMHVGSSVGSSPFQCVWGVSGLVQLEGCILHYRHMGLAISQHCLLYDSGTVTSLTSSESGCYAC